MVSSTHYYSSGEAGVGPGLGWPFAGPTKAVRRQPSFRFTDLPRAHRLQLAQSINP